MAQLTMTFDALLRSIANKDIRSIYVFHGEEGYYVDRLGQAIEELLPAEDRDFALTTMYAPQVESAAVVDMCRSMPMMCERQVVIVKEAQNVRSEWFERLVRYAQSPTPTTVLAVCARGGMVKNKALLDAVKASGGVVYESRKLAEWQVPSVIGKYIASKGLTAEQKPLEMLRDYIGTDLSRLYNEIDKLAQILGPRAAITPEAIERNIGVSKDYNNFELTDAIASRNVEKAFRISKYFAANPRQNPLPVTASLLFSFFADLLMAYYSPDRSDRGIMNELGLKSEARLKRVKLAMSNYNPFQIIDIIDSIRKFDCQSKGNGSRQNAYDLFNDLIYRILTTTGK